MTEVRHEGIARGLTLEQPTLKGPEVTLEHLILSREIEEFYYREALLYDERHYYEWLDLFTDDVRYYMPIRRNVRFGEQAEREETREQQDISWIDEGKTTLTQRIQQIMTGIHWAEEPLSRINHYVTNVLIIDKRENGTELTVKSHFLTYRNRVETETDYFAGRRIDTLRKVDGEWKISRRKVILEQNVLLAKNLTLLF
mgnify:CR=1 FL=1